MNRVLAGAAAMLALFVIDRVLLRLEARRWIYYRTRRRARSAAARSAAELAAIFDPNVKGIVEESMADDPGEWFEPRG